MQSFQYYNKCVRNKSFRNQNNQVNQTHEIQNNQNDIMLPNTASMFENEYEEIGTEELMGLNYDITNDENQSNEDQESTQSILSEEIVIEKSDKIVLKIKRGFASHSFCFICKRKTGSKPMTVLPVEAILEIFLKRNMLIPKGARSCSVHLNDNNYVKDEFIDKIPIADNSISITSQKIESIFLSFIIREQKTSNIFKKFKDFSIVTDELCFKTTGFTKDEVYFIFNEIKSLISSENRSKLQSIVLYLFWLKTGLDQKMIANLFEIEHRQTVSNICAQVRSAMLKDFVPKYLGVNRFSRQEWINQNTEMVKSLFDLKDDQFAIIADGTYCYCQKSSNNMVQRKLYSGHKKRPLVKPFVITSSNGRIINVYGDNAATDNDALIMEKVLESDKDLRDLLKKGDLAIFDRGFKECITRLKAVYGLNCKIPTCK